MKLFDYQKEILEKTKEKNRVGYFLDMGLGKTFIGSEKAISFCKPTLIVCQKSKINDWINHFEDLYDFRPRDLTKPKELETFMKEFLQVGVINYELVWRRPELLKLKDFTLMLDESSLIQNPKAKQTKFILSLDPTNVILLSGTPTSGKYENLWTQSYLLGWKLTEKVFLSQFVNFASIYNRLGVRIRTVDRKNPYKNQDRLKRKLRENGAVFLKTEEVLDLPDQIDTTIQVDKTSMLKKFEKDKIVEITKDQFLVGDTTLNKILRARQLCGEYSQPKLQALEDLFNSTNDRLIVFYNFNSELEQIKKLVGSKPISEINGQTKDLSNYENENDSITLVQYQAGSMGLNLQKANKIVYFTPPLRSELFEQSKKRIHRIGQHQPCFYYYLTTKNSIEEKIYSALARRKDFTDELFNENFE